MTDECLQCGKEYKFVGKHMARSQSCSLTNDILIDELQRVANKLKETPSRPDMGEHGRFSAMPYRSSFGSWNEALKAAGLELNDEQNIGEGRLVDELQQLEDELGKTPSKRNMEEHGKFSAATYQNNFGSWNEALKAAELELNMIGSYKRKVRKDELVDELQRLADELGKTPSRPDMAEHGKFGTTTYEKKFGLWNEALNAAGFDPIREYPIEVQWGDGVEDFYGESWPEKREKALDRDGHECQVCGDDKSLLHVHHITPRRTFERPDDSNMLDNLVTLCADCHGTYEGHWTDVEVDKFVEKATEEKPEPQIVSETTNQ